MKRQRQKSHEALRGARRVAPKRVLRRAAYILLALAPVSYAEHNNDFGVPRQANASPATTIPLHPLGYVPPGPALLLERIASTTLNFIDSDRLLLTFHQGGLMKRDSDAQPDDDDQLIRAEVIDVATGKLQTSTTWRMHDRAQYLWSVGAGQFLVRQRDAIFSTDASLELKPFARFPGMLQSVQLSPGGKLLVAETQEPAPKPASTLTVNDPEASDESTRPIVVRVLNLATMSLVAQTRTRVAPRIPIVETGYLEALHEMGEHWLVNFKGFDDRVRKIAAVSSACSPDLRFLNETVVMISSCDRTLKGRQLTAVTLDGKALWDRRTDGHRIWPVFTGSADGSRFAIETLVLNHFVSATDPFDREDVLGQVAEVFDTVGGQSLLVAPAAPVLDSGQNFALSADGRKFAILHNDAIEVYELK